MDALAGKGTNFLLRTDVQGDDLMDNEGSNLFIDLESLGFKNIEISDIYKKQENKKTEVKTEKKPESYLYDKTINCPICGKQTKIKAVKSNAPRIRSKDSDFMIYYDVINPMLYEIQYCKVCGYAGLSGYFNSVTDGQRKTVLTKITANWKSKEYPEVYDIDTAIEQHKLALLCAVVKDSRYSEKAIICLKISWLYRLKEDREQEQTFQKQALQGLELAYQNEPFPIYGLDKYSTLYLIGELYRRIGDNSKATRYFGMVIADIKAPPKIREKVRDQRDLMKESKQGDV